MNKKVLIGIIAVVLIVIIGGAAMAGSDSKDSDFNREGKSVSTDAINLLPDISVMKADSGWVSGGKSAASAGTNVVTAADVTFVNSGYSQNIITTISVYDTVDHAKAKYDEKKAEDSGTYVVTDEKGFEVCYSYTQSAGLMHIKKIVFRDMNVYGEIYSNSGVVHITDKEFKAITDDIEDKIIKAAA